MDKEILKKDLTDRMDKSMSVLDHDLRGLRTGRASVDLLSPVQVEVYGSRQNLTQIATVSTPDARTLSIQVWNKDNAKSVEKAIAESNLGLTTNADGQNIRINIPPLTEERRKELAKLAHKYGENSKISIRSIRQSGNEELKKQEKNKEITEDEHKKLSGEIQKLTDEYNKKIDAAVAAREKEILTM
jgi:ribosome recycling factor